MGHLSNLRANHKGPRGGVSKLLKKPLRKIVQRFRGGIEKLECGHEQLEVSDLMGPTDAIRRRCRYCPDQEKKEPAPHRVERFDSEHGWVVVFEGPPIQAAKEMRAGHYLGHRMRKFGAKGRLLRDWSP